MFSPAIQRIAIRLCLVASVWMGLAPAQAFVLCLEPGGAMNLEVAVDGHCAGCPMSCVGHEFQLTSECNACSPADASWSPESDHVVLTKEDGCSCLDVVLPSTDNDRVQAKSCWPKVESLVALAPAFDESQILPALACSARLRIGCAERPPPGLALLRSVVLLI